MERQYGKNALTLTASENLKVGRFAPKMEISSSKHWNFQGLLYSLLLSGRESGKIWGLIWLLPSALQAMENYIPSWQ